MPRPRSSLGRRERWTWVWVVRFRPMNGMLLDAMIGGGVGESPGTAGTSSIFVREARPTLCHQNFFNYLGITMILDYHLNPQSFIHRPTRCHPPNRSSGSQVDPASLCKLNDRWLGDHERSDIERTLDYFESLVVSIRVGLVCPYENTEWVLSSI